MSLLKSLGIDNQQDMRGAFNTRVRGLIDRIRAHDGEAQASNELAELVPQLCELFVRRHYVRIPGGQDEAEVIQSVNVSFMLASRNPERIIDSPYDYVRTMMVNSVLNGKRGQKEFTNTDGVDGDEKTAFIETVEDDGRRKHRHSLDDLKKELDDAHGDDLRDLIRNNGFTLAEKERLQALFDIIEKDHPDTKPKRLLEEYYLGDMLQPGLYSRLTREMKIPEGTVKRRLSNVHKLIDDAVSTHISDEEDREMLKEKIERIRNFRGSYRPRIESDVGFTTSQLAIEIAGYDENGVQETHPGKRPPMAELPAGRHFINCTEMVRKLHHTATPEHVAKVYQLALEMLASRSEEQVKLSDGPVRAAKEVFIASRPSGGGRHTIYIDDQAAAFVAEQTQMARSKPNAKWLSISAFDKHIGRSAKPDSMQQTFDLLFDLWAKNEPVLIKGKLQPIRSMVDFFDPYNGHSPGKFLEGRELSADVAALVKGKAMYVSPKLRDLAREHLIYKPEEKQKDWMRIVGQQGGVLAALQVYRKTTLEKKMADHLAVIEILQELQQQRTFMMGDPPEEKKASDYLGQFMIGGSRSPLEQDGAWLVNPAIIGEGRPLNKAAVVDRARAILDKPEEHPAYAQALAASRKVG